ncbi:MAG: lysylphosphatidylglycerol synthase transmembrane domain-containing protein [Gammaproteobacteria bacterium]|nr:lysylphosphatidylglycerol synthase transmembrane domain-containing protein [Gammaproteobacteria bacterium]
MRKIILRSISVLLRYGIGIGLIAYLYKTKQIDFKVLQTIDIQTACIALILSFSQLFLSAWRVKMLLASQQIFVGFWRCTIYNAIGIFYSTLLPGAMSGDALRAYYFWQCKQTSNCTKSSLIAALVTDRLIGTVALLFVGLVAATVSAKTMGLSSQSLILLWVAFVGGLGVYLLICRSHQYRWKTTGTRFAFIADASKRFLAALDLSAYPPLVLWSSVLFSALIQISSVLVIFLFAVRLGSGLDFGPVMAVSSIGFLVNALPISPGGLGVGEGSFDFLFGMLGGKYGSNVFLISRIFLFAPAILGAIFAVQLLGSRSKASHLQQSVT